MREGSIAPRILVTIGAQSRLYVAVVTTASADLDAPATLTLHASTWADVSGFAADPLAYERRAGRTPARLVLVDAMELAWQRARILGHQHLVLPADPQRVSLTTLQHWLWQRLRAPLARSAAA
jgi:hypothetical protein